MLALDLGRGLDLPDQARILRIRGALPELGHGALVRVGLFRVRETQQFGPFQEPATGRGARQAFRLAGLDRAFFGLGLGGLDSGRTVVTGSLSSSYGYSP